MRNLPNRSQLNCTYKFMNEILLKNALRHLQQWLPSGRLEGHEYVALNPTRRDRTLGSFRINMKTGKWTDFATQDRGGDLISLYAYLNKCCQSKALQSLRAEVKGGRHGGR